MRHTLLILVLASTPAVANEVRDWRSVAGWDIKERIGSARACFASRVTSDGPEVQIGVAPTLDGGYLAVYNPAWTHIVEGETGRVEFDFGEARFGGEAVARYEDGVPGGYAYFNNPAFVEEFSRRYDVRITGSRGTIFEMDLTGTRKAVAEVLACQSGTTP